MGFCSRPRVLRILHNFRIYIAGHPQPPSSPPPPSPPPFPESRNHHISGVVPAGSIPSSSSSTNNKVIPKQLRRIRRYPARNDFGGREKRITTTTSLYREIIRHGTNAARIVVDTYNIILYARCTPTPFYHPGILERVARLPRYGYHPPHPRRVDEAFEV